MNQIAPLQPLRIPAGWRVNYNDFREIDPSAEAVQDLLLREDLLQLVLDEPRRVVDLGWYGGVEGAFGVCCVEPDFHGQTLAEFRTRNRFEAVAAVERLLAQHVRG